MIDSFQPKLIKLKGLPGQTKFIGIWGRLWPQGDWREIEDKFWFRAICEIVLKYGILENFGALFITAETLMHCTSQYFSTVIHWTRNWSFEDENVFSKFKEKDRLKECFPYFPISSMVPQMCASNYEEKMV